MASPKIGRQLEKVMRDWRGIKAAIGDRIFYVSVDATCQPAIHEAWVEAVDQTRVLVRTAASPFGDVTGNGQGTRWLHQSRTSSLSRGKALHDRWHEALPDQPFPPSADTGDVACREPCPRSSACAGTSAGRHGGLDTEQRLATPAAAGSL